MENTKGAAGMPAQDFSSPTYMARRLMKRGANRALAFACFQLGRTRTTSRMQYWQSVCFLLNQRHLPKPAQLPA
jgi:hypothetical protein